MDKNIAQRFDDLIKIGNELIRRIPNDTGGRPIFWIPERQMPEYQSWISSASNLLRVVAPKDSHYIDEYHRLMQLKDLQNGISYNVVSKIHGLLISAQNEWANGLLRKIEYIIAAESFDDFLDHAASYHRGNKKKEAAVLASAVLEDAIKKIATKNAIMSKEKKLDELIDSFVSNNLITPVKAKRLKSYAGIRNNALHAEWDGFDIKDVGEMIKGIREIIENFM